MNVAGNSVRKHFFRGKKLFCQFFSFSTPLEQPSTRFLGTGAQNPAMATYLFNTKDRALPTQFVAGLILFLAMTPPSLSCYNTTIE